MYGYVGKILDIDLSSKESRIYPLEEDIARNFIGGKGFGGVLLFKEMPPNVDPYSPESLVLIASGPLTGTLCPSTRTVIIGKSPLSGTFCDSYVGGHLGPEMKFAGYDAVMVRGKSESPCYIYVNDGDVQFRSASHLWGKDIVETDEILKKEIGRNVHIAAIGPAGENGVKYSLIAVDVHRQAARGGLGAVLGKKNLKAIAIRGSGSIPLYKPKQFVNLSKKIKSEILNPDNSGMVVLRKLGTGRSTLFSSDNNLFPTRNFTSGMFDRVRDISGQKMRECFWVKDKACFGCPINCSKFGILKKGPFRGVALEGVEYETVALLGSNLDNGNLETLIKANELCDRLGLDSLSTGNTIGFIMECFEEGLVKEKDIDGIRAEFGNGEAVINLIQKIARREGIGDLLSRGVKEVAQEIGSGSEKFAMHVKGLEMPGWGVRASPGMGLAYATAERGADHERAFPISYEVKGAETPDGRVLERYGTEGKAYVTKFEQDLNAFFFSAALCDMVIGSVGLEHCVELINYGTGFDINPQEPHSIGERIWNMVRLYNIREGFSRADDRLPTRLHNEAVRGGDGKGRSFPLEDFEKMLDDYYSLRGWDSRGVPTSEKCHELKIEKYYEKLGLGQE